VSTNGSTLATPPGSFHDGDQIRDGPCHGSRIALDSTLLDRPPPTTWHEHQIAHRIPSRATMRKGREDGGNRRQTRSVDIGKAGAIRDATAEPGHSRKLRTRLPVANAAHAANTRNITVQRAPNAATERRRDARSRKRRTAYRRSLRRRTGWRGEPEPWCHASELSSSKGHASVARGRFDWQTILQQDQKVPVAAVEALRVWVRQSIAGVVHTTAVSPPSRAGGRHRLVGQCHRTLGINTRRFGGLGVGRRVHHGGQARFP
jgi:hypothetical protein